MIYYYYCNIVIIYIIYLLNGFIKPNFFFHFSYKFITIKSLFVITLKFRITKPNLSSTQIQPF